MKDPKIVSQAFWKVFLCVMIPSFVLINPCSGAEDPAKFPSKPITMIIHFNPGGTSDLSGRKLADLAAKSLGQPIVCENKAGGAGVIAINAVAKAERDGYTIGTVTYSPTVFAPHFRSVPYNVKEDFTWLMQYAELPQPFCVLSNARWKTLKEFIEEGRKNPGKLTYTTPGPKSGMHVLMEEIALAENVKLIHVPTAAGSEAVTQLLGGHVDASVVGAVAPHLRTGKVRALAIAGEKRSTYVPDIPTFFELGYKVETPLWAGLIAPKGLDPRILKKLTDAFKKAYDDPSFKDLLTSLVMTPVYREPEPFKQMVVKDFDSQKKILEKLGFIK